MQANESHKVSNLASCDAQCLRASQYAPAQFLFSGNSLVRLVTLTIAALLTLPAAAQGLRSGALKVESDIGGTNNSVTAAPLGVRQPSEIGPTLRNPLSPDQLLPTAAPRVVLPEPIRVQSPGAVTVDGIDSDRLDPALDYALGGPQRWASPEGLSGSLQIMLLLTVLSLAPAVLLMTTCYVRIIVVLGLLRQAIGLPSLPPAQVMTSISLFITLFVMTPVWTRVYDEAIQPYTDPEIEMSTSEAWEKGTLPIREFMSRQIAAAENYDDVMLFYNYAHPDDPPPETFRDVPLRVLLPAFMLSELKTAFLMGFQIYLPFLIVDLVVASVTISMGMLMLPPSVISLPFKLLLFVLVDGWRLVVEMLLISFGH